MSQKQATLLIILLIAVGLGGAGVNYLRQQMQLIIPTPTVAPVVFDKLTPIPSQSIVVPQTVRRYTKPPALLNSVDLQNKKAVVQTTKGVFEFIIYPEATRSASNFIFLANEQFYDGLTFHRVVPGFVIQGGDPLGNGTGGPGYTFQDDLINRAYLRGTVAMANSGPNTNGSQFFVVLQDQPSLPPQYSIFGLVVTGMETVDQIAIGDQMLKVTITPY